MKTIKYLIIVILLTLTFNSYAGVITKGASIILPSNKSMFVISAVAAGSYIIYSSQVSVFFEKTYNKNISKDSKINDLKIKYWDMIYNEKYDIDKRIRKRKEIQSILRYYMIRYPETAGIVAYDVANKLRIFDIDYENMIKNDLAVGNKLIADFVAVVEKDRLEDKNENCNKSLIYAKRDKYNMEYIKSRVEELDYGPYSDLVYVSTKTGVGDKLDLDHIPAKAAIFKYLERRDPASIVKNSKKEVYNNTTAVAIDEIIHRMGRTYASKPILVEEDSKNLLKATMLDFKVHFLNYRIKRSIDSNEYKKMITSFYNVYKRNKKLCIYL